MMMYIKINKTVFRKGLACTVILKCVLTPVQYVVRCEFSNPFRTLLFKHCW